jgi:hypothetical protein
MAKKKSKPQPRGTPEKVTSGAKEGGLADLPDAARNELAKGELGFIPDNLDTTIVAVPRSTFVGMLAA